MALTHVVDDEAFALAKDKPGWIRMEGDSQVRGGGGQLEGAATPHVPPQDPCRDLVAVGDGQHVTVTDVQSEDSERNRVSEREKCSRWYQLKL